MLWLWPALVVPALLAAQSELIKALREAAWGHDWVRAERLVEQYRAQHPAVTPQLLEAVSWAARAASFAGQWDEAERYGREAFEGSQKILEHRALEASERLPLSQTLGASIEVLAAVDVGRGDRGGALQFLEEQRARYKGTPIEARIQKNILLLTLEGKPAPKLDEPQWIGEKPATLAELRGRVVLLFFWAHWCKDCKREMPVLAQLEQNYGRRGLTIVGPTQLYGYVAGGEPATPEQEMNYIRGPYRRAHPIPAWMRAPVSGANFLRFGVSTTPTLVLVDRAGTVRLYHPGTLSYEDLAAKIGPLLAAHT